MRAHFLILVCSALSACGPHADPRPAARPAPEATLKQTIALPGGGQVHIISMPVDDIDTARCLVATSQTGNVSVACASPRIDLTPDP